MTAALYLDPRFRRQILSDPVKVSEATALLERVWLRINSQDNTDNNTSANSDSDSDFEFNEHAELEKYLAGSQYNSQTNAREVNSTDITSILECFDPDHLSSSESVLQYWEKNKNKHPQLYNLAEVIFAIPPTEVQIERDFSQLNFVFTDRRCQLAEDRLEDIMILHINTDLFETVANEQLDEAKIKFANRKSTAAKQLFGSP